MRTAETCAGTATPSAAGSISTAAYLLRDPTDWRRELLRYGAAAAFMASLGTILFQAFGTPNDSVEAIQSQQAVLVDLPPALASSRPQSSADEGPEQQASQASPVTPTPPKPADDVKPIEEPLPQPAERAEEKPPEDRKAEPAVAAPSPPVTEQAPAGTETPVAGAHPENSEGQAQASTREITAWQLSLVGRLEAAKRALPRGTKRPAGTVQIAFAVDREGRIVSDRVARSSGSAALDNVALALVRRAAPFPGPPGGTASRDMSFIVPIRFKR